MKISTELSRKITAANIIFTFLIVWHHLSWNYGPTEITTISGIAVPCFFALSSFLYFISFDFNQLWISYTQKVRSRTFSLLMPFVIYSLVGIVFWFIASKYNGGSKNPIEDIQTYGLFNYIFKCKPNGPLWYLLALYSFVLIAPLLGMVIKISKYSILLIIPLFILSHHFDYHSFPHWIANLFFGAYVAIYFDSIKKLAIFKHPLVCILFFLAGISLLLIISDIYLWRALAPVCIVAIVGAFSLFPPLPDIFHSFISFVAQFSLMIYCLHIPVSRITQRIPGMVGIANPLMQLIVCCMVTISVIVVAGYLIRKQKWIWYVCTGGR